MRHLIFKQNNVIIDIREYLYVVKPKYEQQKNSEKRETIIGTCIIMNDMSTIHTESNPRMDSKIVQEKDEFALYPKVCYSYKSGI